MSRKNKNKKSIGSPAMESIPTAPGDGSPRKPQPTWLEYWTVRMSRWLGSLQVAVLLLSVFAAVLAIGTMVESWYSGHIAQELVYRAWWFTLLLFLLGINIFCAAAKKWPWKKHQTGFLITHVGLLTMLAGGILTSLSGTDAVMSLLDSPSGDPQGEYPYPQSSNQIILTDDFQLTVKQQTKEKESARDYDFVPGSFAWHADETFQPDYDAMLAVLNVLAHPLPHYWECETENGARMQVVNYYPHARQEPFSPIERRARGGFPAIKVQLASPQFGRVQGQWLALYFSDHEDPHQRQQRAWPFYRVGPAMMELLGLIPSELVDEFKNPPAAGPDMKMGQLVLRIDGKTHRFYVAENLGKTLDLGNGKQVKIVKYIANSSTDAESARDQAAPPFDPVVEFELTARNKTTRFRTCARANTRSSVVDDKGKPAVDDVGEPLPVPDVPDLLTWYHPPDQSFGAGNQQRGVLQFVQTTDGQLLYRSFHQVGGLLQLEKPGEELSHLGEPIAIWAGMKWRFYLQDHLPSAKFEARLAPENARPGLEKVELSPAIRCKLTNKKDSQEFWLLLGQIRRLQVGGDRFTVEYGRKMRELDFDLKLLRAEQTVDPGTQSAASYSSFVQLSDGGRFSHSWVPGPLRDLTNAIGLTQGGEAIEAEDHWITMNAPLNHRGYKVYQSQYDFRGFNEKTDKPVNRSGFTVGRDPGLWLKYIGSTMLALGIATMFYMRAYFFKPRGRSRSTDASVPDAIQTLSTTTATAPS